MGQFIESLGQTMVGQAAEGALGLVLGGINDQRQIKQQQRLQELQIAGQKEMTDYSYAKQLQMWKDTNYSAQMEQLIKAGLNPGLIYGMGGGGGATTGGGSGQVTGATAPTGGKEAQELMGMGIQAQLLKSQRDLITAQKENVEADTANKQAENPNIPKQGQVLEAQAANLTQGIENQKAQQKYTEAQTDLAEIQKDIQGSEINDMKAVIKYGMRKLYSEMLSSEITANVDKETQISKIKQAQATLAMTAMETYLKSTQAQGIKQEMKESVQRIYESFRRTVEAYKHNDIEYLKLQQGNRSLDLQDQMVDYNTAVPPEIKAILDNIFIVPSLGGTPKMNKIGYK